MECRFFRRIIEECDFKFRRAPRKIKPITVPRFRSKLDDAVSAVFSQRGQLELNGVELKVRVILIGETQLETSGELLSVPGLIAGDRGRETTQRCQPQARFTGRELTRRIVGFDARA